MNRADRRRLDAIGRRALATDRWDWQERPEAVRLARQGAFTPEGATHRLCWMIKAWTSAIYAVQLHERPQDHCIDPDGRRLQVKWLAVSRHDGMSTFPWGHLQRIKNELVGPDRLAVQVFPPVDEVVDSANMAHLWVYPLGFQLGFTLVDR